jgi:hypothetical protein
MLSQDTERSACLVIVIAHTPLKWHSAVHAIGHEDNTCDHVYEEQIIRADTFRLTGASRRPSTMDWAQARQDLGPAARRKCGNTGKPLLDAVARDRAARHCMCAFSPSPRFESAPRCASDLRVPAEMSLMGHIRAFTADEVIKAKSRVRYASASREAPWPLSGRECRSLR